MILNGDGMYVGDGSRIPVPIHVDEAEVEADFTPDFVKSSVGLVMVLDHVAVSSIAEGSVGGVLAVAEFVVSALTDVELDWAASGYSCVAGSVTAGIG